MTRFSTLQSHHSMKLFGYQLYNETNTTATYITDFAWIRLFCLFFENCQLKIQMRKNKRILYDFFIINWFFYKRKNMLIFHRSQTLYCIVKWREMIMLYMYVKWLYIWTIQLNPVKWLLELKHWGRLLFWSEQEINNYGHSYSIFLCPVQICEQ